MTVLRSRPVTRNLQLTEYEPRSIHFPLDKGQLKALNAAHVEVTPSPFEGETYILRPLSYIGAVHTGGLSVVIRPKIPIDRLMFLIAYAIDHKNWWRESFNLLPDLDVLESIILAFTHHTRQAVQHGLLQGYRREEEALHTVRGRIRFHEQIRRRFDIPLPVEVTFDEFTEDIEENRLLKAALYRLARLPGRSAQAQQGVTGLRPVFNTVSFDDYRRGPPEVQYTRLNSHYRSAVELARLIVANASLELYHGEVAGASLLLDMNKVFEKFLYVALGEALSLPQSQWQTQAGLTLDKADAIRMHPDLSWWNGRRCLFVGDAKYKKLETNEFQHADIYQMLAYCTAADLPSGLLIYAAGEDELREYKIWNADKTIEVASLHLNGTPETILGEVASLAERVKSHTYASPAHT